MKQIYEAIDVGYAGAGSQSPCIAQSILLVLGDAHAQMNVGTSMRHYEPVDRYAVAAKPALKMLTQSRLNSLPVVRAIAKALPFGDHTFDAALAVLTLQHWSDSAAGLTEMRWVARRQLRLLFEPTMSHQLWLFGYYPESWSLPSELCTLGDRADARLLVRSIGCAFVNSGRLHRQGRWCVVEET